VWIKKVFEVYLFEELNALEFQVHWVCKSEAVMLTVMMFVAFAQMENAVATFCPAWETGLP
jgi:hypothetical protein